MSTDTQNIVNKAWNFAHVLRDDGLSYMAYTEQITFLLFLKMADEVTRPPHSRRPIVPPALGWPSLMRLDGDELEAQYRHILEELAKKPGMLGEIFKKARPEIQNPATLKRLIVDLIDPENWSSMEADVKGDIYEGLLARSAAESPKGAGQYFTPRELIKGIVDCVQPTPNDRICDPACGTGGFLLAAHEYVARHCGKELDPDQKKHLRKTFVLGWELVPNTARLCIMNLYLHGFDARPAQEKAWTTKLWVYDLRTNMHFTQKQNPLQRSDLDDFVKSYNPENRHRRRQTWSDKNPEGRWRSFDYEELAKRDKVNLDIFWLKDESLEDSEDLPDPNVLAQEIVDDLQTALEQFSAVVEGLKE
jgi:type I restriction-modification system DNA methylase subunit